MNSAGCAVAFGLLSLACTRRVINDSHSGTPRELGSHPEAGATPVGSHSAATPSPDAGPASKSKLLPPLQAAEPTLALEVPGFRTAVVSVPTGAREPRPVWVALHGNFDRPEWQCGVWREVTGAFPFILCPRGSPRTDAPKSLDRWTYLGVAQTEKELEAGLEALRSRFTGYVSDGTVVFLGFSLGAIQGVTLLVHHPERYQRAVLIEGGFESWSLPRARAFVTGGGQRVLFACAQAGCPAQSKQAARTLERAGALTRVAFKAPTVHTYDGPVAESVRDNLGWLLEGDGRYSAAD